MWLKNGNSMYNLAQFGKIELKLEDLNYYFVLSNAVGDKLVPVVKIGPFKPNEVDRYYAEIMSAMNVGSSVWVFPDSAEI